MVLFTNTVRVRPDAPHLAPIQMMSVMLLAAMLGGESIHFRGRHFTTALLAALVVAYFSSGSVMAKVTYMHSSRDDEFLFTIPRAAGITVTGGPERVHDAACLQRAVEYVQRHVPSSQPIFVGNLRHDRLVINNAMFYFLAERPCVNKYQSLDPGQVTTEVVQREIAEDIEAEQLEIIVLWDGGNWDEPNASAVSSGVTVLDDYIATTFRPMERFGSYTICVRR